MRGSARIAFVGVASAMLACAGQPAIDVTSHPWHEVRGSLFVLRSDARHADLERLATDLEVFIEVVRRVSDFRVEPPRYDLRIYLLREPKRLFGALGWHTQGSRSGDLVVLSRFDSLDLTRSVLYHEFVHFLLGAHASYTPRWYHEGLAEMLSTVYRRDGLVTVGYVPQDRMPLLHQSQRSPLRALLAAHDYDIPDFYGLAWLWVHYLHAGGGGRREQGVDFLAGLGRGEPWEGAFGASFGVAPEALEADLDRHRRQLARGQLPLLELDVEGLGSAAPPAATPISASAAAADLGSLLLRWGAADAALSTLEPVVEVHPDDARARAVLAWAQVATLQGGTARRNLERSLAQAGSDPHVQLLAGRIAMYASEGASASDRHARERARIHFRRATELDPELPAGWAELGLSYAVEGERDAPEEALVALERSLALRPADAELHLALGRLLLRSGQPTRAREHLLRVERWSFDEAWREEARELMQQIEANGR